MDKKKIGRLFLKPNITYEEGGGLTSKLIPFQFGKLGIGLFAGVSSAASLGVEMVRQHNKMAIGPVTYEGGPSRMTHNVTSGAIEAIKQSTNDPEVQADMLRNIVKNNDDGIRQSIEEFGVDGEFISAFYGMGQ